MLQITWNYAPGRKQSIESLVRQLNGIFCTLEESETHEKDRRSTANADRKKRVLLTILAVSCRTRLLCDSSQASSTAFMASKTEEHEICHD